MEISKALKEQAKACETAEELMALAKANEIELSVEDAEFLLKDFAEKELADNELENVAGGTDGCVKPGNPYPMEYWNTKEEVQFIFNVGDTVEAFGDFGHHHTATCKVTDRMAVQYKINEQIWIDKYYLEKVKGSKTPHSDGWVQRNDIER